MNTYMAHKLLCVDKYIGIAGALTNVHTVESGNVGRNVHTHTHTNVHTGECEHRQT